MSSQFSETDFFNTTIIKRSLKRYKLIIIAATVISGLSGLLATMFIEPTYRSVATVYPNNLELFSNESSTEQMMQWLRGRNVMDIVVSTYNLQSHWGIDSTDRQFEHKLTKAYNRSIRFKKTLYESVDIDVRMNDPKLTCLVAKGVVDAYNASVQLEWKRKHKEQVDNFQRIIEQKNMEIDSVQVVHSVLRQTYEITDYEAQSKEVARGYLGTVDASGGSTINKEGVKRMKDNLERKGGDFLRAHYTLEHLLEERSLIQREYDAVMRLYKSEFTFASMVSPPVISDKAYAPVRLVYIIAGMFAGFVLSILYSVRRERVRA
jgi:capsular polysaccharide biosynthesis protein